MFSVNEGPLDRGVRVVLGAVVLWLGTVSGMVEGGVAVALWVVAAVLILTGITGFCGAYKLLGIDTCPKPKG